MKPMIGVIALYDEEKESYWMLPEYMKGLEQVGAVPVMLPLTEDQTVIMELVQKMDGFLLTGGHDVNPAIYKEEIAADCGVLCDLRDRMEVKLLEEAMKLDKPIFGICRGLQLLNAVLQGSLYQDLLRQTQTAVEHQQAQPYDQPAHSVAVERDSPLYRLLGKEELQVNSCHHQGIKQLSPQLRVMATAPDGLIEAVYHPHYTFLQAVQWHPELSYLNDGISQKIFQAFVHACEKKLEGLV